MTLQLSPDHVTRLALARYLLQHAGTLVQYPPPLCSLALLSTHDAIEMVLDVLAEAGNVAIPPRTDFSGYWNAFRSKINPVHLPLERQMRRLNAARVGLKHHGQRPSGDQLIAHLSNARAFIEDVCDKNFGLALPEISMAELIKNDRVRAFIKDAQEAIGRNDLQEAFLKAALAFAYGSADANQKIDTPPRERLGTLSVTAGVEIERLIRPILTKIDDTIKQMSDRYDRTIGLVALGIDLDNYNRPPYPVNAGSAPLI